jgi:hypothetical protein
MRNTGEDWLSRTMRMVEAVMQRYGFEEESTQRVELQTKPTTKPAANPASDGNLSGWNRLLRRAAFLSPL